MVRARVEHALGAGRWTVSVDGRMMSARSTVPLVVGQILTARVERTLNTLFLRIDSHPSIAEFLQSNHLPSDVLTRMVVEALMRAGLPLDAAQIRRLRAVLARNPGSPGLAERGRLLALAAGKKLDLSPEALDALSQYAGDRRRGDQSGDHPADHRRHRSRSGRDAENEEQIVRGATSRSSRNPEHPAQLFNHAAGPPDDHWIIVPISWTAGQARFDGSLRLCLSLDRSTVVRGALVVYTERNRWGFEWQMSDGRARHLTLHPPAGAFEESARASEHYRRELKRLLPLVRAYGVDSLDIEQTAKAFDGFSSPLPMDIMTPVREDA
ncbi:MAG: hypothetical protein EA384_07045 [Spirochaetaceae bacterium]|nr:MAG: hypothetical protein EA384_07045 [Spirochaetaceae bacterium]